MDNTQFIEKALHAWTILAEQCFASQSAYVWISQFALVILLTICARLIQSIIFRKTLKKLEKKHRIWDEVFVFSLQKPLAFLIWLLGLLYAVEILKENIPGLDLFDWINTVRIVGVIVALAWFLSRAIDRTEKHLTDPGVGEKVFDKTSVGAVARILKIALVVATVMTVLQSNGISISGVLAIGGAGTLAIGFAAKDMFANFFGGIMIFTDRPFAIGDWIRSPDRDIEGTVEHIGWRTTCIRRFNKRPLYVPNSIFTTVSVENPSRMTNRQIKEIISLRYQDAAVLPKILSEIETMVKTHPDIDAKQTTFITFGEFGPSSLDCELYCFTKTTQWVPYLKIQQDVFLKVLDIVSKHGAEVAFPTRQIHMDAPAPVSNA